MKSVVLGALLVGSCVFPQVVPEASGEFHPTGSIQRGALGASFDGARIVSPNITLSRRTDGSWGGRFALAGSGDAQALDVSVAEHEVRGVDFVMVRERDGAKTTISGAFKGKTFRFELSPALLSVHTTRFSGDYAGREQLGDGSVRYGPRGELSLTGEAAAETIAWPQLGFALVAAFY
jgi:hypothetical protein